MYLRPLIVLIIFALSAGAVFGQIVQIELVGGTSYYAGEFNRFGKPVFLKPSGSINLLWALSKRISVGAGFTYARVEGDDSKSKSDWEVNRNLYFRSDIHEITGIVELNFLNYKPGDMLDFPYTPYIFVGMGVARMNPKGKFKGEFIELQPLGTEGQGSGNGQKYRLNQVVIPFGFGFKVNMNPSSTIGFEYGIRKTFTDYLDDVSGYYVGTEELALENGVVAAQMADQSIEQEAGDNARVLRGNPTNKDWYMQAGITLSFMLRGPNPCDNFGKKRY